ncbi:MAG: hypothetical protein ACE5HU_03760 [Acidobacteriota bacterium]
MRRIPWILSTSVLLAATIAMTGGDSGRSDSVVSCEPAGPIDLQARVVSVDRQGAKAKVVVEIMMRPHRRLASSRIECSLASGNGPGRSLGVLDTSLSMAGGTVRRITQELDLDEGVEHHLRFTARAQTRAGPSVETTAYLRVNLDPRLEPEDLGDLLQFRANMKGR